MLKSSKSSEKQEFINELLTSESWESEYFKRITKVDAVKRSTKQRKWLSYKKMLEHHSPQVITWMVRKGKLLTRPHPGMEEADEELNAIPAEERLQYQQVEEGSEDEATITESVVNKDQPTKLPEQKNEEMEAEQQALKLKRLSRY